ncbi:MAG: hypothetical protein J6M02_07175 [Clostridia bacterium]|nr:hypothetical protein [Clostridia bacterium]
MKNMEILKGRVGLDFASGTFPFCEKKKEISQNGNVPDAKKKKEISQNGNVPDAKKKKEISQNGNVPDAKKEGDFAKWKRPRCKIDLYCF